jgi:flavin-dependent dehydrogenase
LDARLKNAIQATASVATAPVSPAPYRTIVEDALVAGDAGGFLDPFTGDGISVALHSGLLSAEILAEARTDSLELLSGNNLFREYDRRLSQAVRRSYRVARSLRALADAPDYCQAAAIRLLAWFGQHLVAHTRWRSTRESPVIISREGTLNGPFGHV